ncbi:MAG: glutamine synthetase family protein [bacterium]
MTAQKGKIDPKNLNKLVEDGEIESIIVCGVDMQGRLFGKRFTATCFIESFKGGINTCACNFGWDMDLILIPGLKFTGWHTGYQDMLAAPDMNTLRMVPWLVKTAIVLCDSCDEGGEPLSIAPRTILRRVSDKAKKMGYTPYMASELEWFMFKETVESAREKGYINLEPISKYYSDYSIFRSTLDEWILGPIRIGLNELGMEVESTKAEWGFGQVELAIRYTEALEMGDRHALVKHAVKEISALKGAMASFMAKYKTDDSGSGLHIHTSLWDKDAKKSLFPDKKKEHGMSDTMRYFLGGQMQLANDMQYFYAPLINSYKRYCPKSFAPYNVGWGGDNRTVTFRICGSGNSLRIENRIPGADANGHLALAASLAAGLYGIEHKLEPVGPFIEGDSYEEKSLPVLPNNLSDAVKNLEKSEAAREMFGDDVIDHYVKIGRWEVDTFNSSVTDWERRKYFEMT